MAHVRSTFPTKPIANLDSVVSGPKYRFTVLTDGLIRYEYAPDGSFEDRASTFAINRNLGFVPVFKTYEDGSVLEIITDRFHLTYDRQPFSSSGLFVDVKGKITDWGSRWRFGVDENDWAGLENLGGTARTLDGEDGRCRLENGVLGRAGFAALDDSNTMLFDGNGWVATRKPSGSEGKRIDGYLFAYGHDFKAAIKAFYAVSGKQPAVPRWALGNWWSRYHPYNADEYLGLMDRFRKESVPLSVAVVDMDWHYVIDEKVTSAGWTGYSWNRKLFPDPKQFCHELHERGLRITLNDHPADGVHAFEDSYEEVAKAIGFDTSQKKPIEFDPTNKPFFDAFFDVLHRRLEDDGADFWWSDWQQGTLSRVPGIDPLWMLNHFHFLDNARDGKTPMLFSRYAGPGSHRYPVGFSGDSVVSWASLDFQPEFTATSSNIGYGWWSHDIGGHLLGGKDDELITRWFQLGVFSPIMRLHSTLSEWNSKEPWKYQKECRGIMENFLRFRHRIIPYLYTMNVRSALEDEPLIQPLYWAYPKERDAYLNKNQYFFGSQLLVAPITKPRCLVSRMGTVQAWLPPGRKYVDIFKGTVYDGGSTVTLYRELDYYPLFAKEGAIIPFDGAEMLANGGPNPQEYEIIVVVGQDGKFVIVEDIRDDGRSARSEELAGQQRQIPITWTQTEGNLRIGPAKAADGGAEDEGRKRSWKIKFISYRAADTKDVRAVGFEAEVVIDRSAAGGTIVHVRDVPSTEELEIVVGKMIQLDVLDVRESCHGIINGFQCKYDIKDKLYECVKKEGMPLSMRVSRVLSSGADESLTGPVLELLLADSRLASSAHFVPSAS